MLIITPAVGPYGGWNMFYRLLKYFNNNFLTSGKDRNLITILSTGPWDSRLNDFNTLGFRFHSIRWFNYNRYVHKLEKSTVLNLMINFPLLLMAFAYLLIKGNKVRVVVSNGFLCCIPAIFYKRLSNKKNLTICPWLHTDNRFSEKRIARDLLKFSVGQIDRFFVNSMDIKNDLMTSGISDQKITVVNNWVDGLALTTNEEMSLDSKYHQFKGYDFRVVYLGRFVEYKHFVTYLKVAECTASQRIAFIFIGDGELLHLIRQSISKNRHIYTFSNIPDKDVRYFLKNSNLTLVYADENYLGLTAYESLHSGTPVLYVGFSAAPDKYSRKVTINRNLLPESISFKTTESIDDISKLIISLDEQRYPSKTIREECLSYVQRYHSDKNAQTIVSHLFSN